MEGSSDWMAGQRGGEEASVSLMEECKGRRDYRIRKGCRVWRGYRAREGCSD